MKRIAALILLVLYFVTSTGATLHYHYCMGEIASSSFVRDRGDQCGKCGMEIKENEDNGCCNDEQQWIKIEDDQKAGTAQIEISKLQLETIGFFFLNNYSFASQDNDPFAAGKARLRSCELPTYLLNCVFRI